MYRQMQAYTRYYTAETLPVDCLELIQYHEGVVDHSIGCSVTYDDVYEKAASVSVYIKYEDGTKQFVSIERTPDTSYRKPKRLAYIQSLKSIQTVYITTVMPNDDKKTELNVTSKLHPMIYIEDMTEEEYEQWCDDQYMYEQMDAESDRDDDAY